MALRTCGGCGIPKAIIKRLQWRDNGLLEMKPNDLRVNWIEGDFYMSIQEGIEELLGISIEYIIINAMNNLAKRATDDILSGLPGKIVRLRPFRRLAFQYIIKEGHILGLIKGELVKYRPGKEVRIKCEYLAQSVYMAGNALGAFRSIEGMNGVVNCEKKGDYYYIEIHASKDAPIEERLRLDPPPVIDAQVSFERCPVCRAPREMSRFRWDLEDGKITEESTGKLLGLGEVYGLNATLREIEEELGDEVPQWVADNTRKFYHRLIAEHPDAPFTDLSFMEAKGYGVPEIKNPTPEDLASGVRIRNPFCLPAVAGMVAAVCGGEDSDFEWSSPEEGVLSVTVKD